MLRHSVNAQIVKTSAPKLKENNIKVIILPQSSNMLKALCTLSLAVKRKLACPVKDLSRCGFMVISNIIASQSSFIKSP